ncbi:MAG: DUF4430 domain-containing protein [Firmicutes bacterium]|nr:DUF4430 domain-containing protein [Bacillota bacterium]
MFKRKIIALLATALMAITVVVAFTACETVTPLAEGEYISVSVAVIGSDGEVILEIERDYDTNRVLDILIANNDKLEIPETQLDSGFITTIAGITAVWGEAGNQWWWQFDINGTMAPVGVRDARVSNGDKITFTLTAGG